MGLPDAHRAARHCSPCANMRHIGINKLELCHGKCAPQQGELTSLRSETGQKRHYKTDYTAPKAEMPSFGAPSTPHDGAIARKSSACSVML
jgi:hypothetical protein